MYRWHSIGREGSLSKELINCAGEFSGKELSVGIGPSVFLGTGYVHWPRSHQGDQHVLINRKGRFVVAVLIEVVAEPVREGQLVSGLTP